jgi:hypothetical protein
MLIEEPDASLSPFCVDEIFTPSNFKIHTRSHVKEFVPLMFDIGVPSQELSNTKLIGLSCN